MPVHIKTRDIPLEEQIEIDVAGGDRGSLGTEGKNASLTYGNRFTDGFGLQGTLSFYRNPLLKEKTKLNADGLLSEAEEEDKPTETRTAQFDAGWFYGAGEVHFKPLFIENEEDKDKIKGKYNATGTLTGSEQEEEIKTKTTSGALLENRHKLSKTMKIDTSLAYYETAEEKEKVKRVLNAASVEDPSKRELEFEDKNDSLWQLESKLSQRWGMETLNELKYGIKMRFKDRSKDKERFKNDVLQTAGVKDIYELEENYYAAFLQNETRFSEAFSVLPGVRAEYVELTTHDGAGNTGNDYQMDVLPSLSAKYKFNDSFNIYGAVSKAVNRPKYDELTPFVEEKGDKFVLGNPELEPATAIAYDAGFNYVTEPFFFGFNLFYRDVEGVIESRLTGEVIDGKSVEQVQNVGDGWVRGIELEQRWAISSRFTITANESFLDSELTNNDGTKAPFKEQPEIIANLILDWTLPTLGTTFSLAGNYVDEFDATETGDGRESETFVDFKLTQPIGKNASVYFLAENITDEERVKFKTDGTAEEEGTGKYFYLGVTAHF